LLVVGKVLEVTDLFDRDRTATDIADMFYQWQMKRTEKIEQLKELRNYLFATDTSHTSNSALPWKNTTTTPKLTQIRDTLHANYMAALFPSDNWLIWEGGDEDSVSSEKRKAIEAYMDNKLRAGGFEETISQLVLDFIDTGNPIGDVEYVEESHETEDGEIVPGFTGPRIVRHSLYDVVFNPVARSFKDSPKITRYIKTLGELRNQAETMPEYRYNLDILGKSDAIRNQLSFTDIADSAKNEAFSVDGFGTLQDYFQSSYVEILEFEGDIHDSNGVLRKNRLITIIDRSFVIRDIPHPSWTGKGTKEHCAWRQRPDNLYGMGALDNLVGLQYRIDHLENLSADALDLMVLPILAFRGNVEEFNYEPLGEIFLGDDGEVIELGKNLNGVAAAKQDIAAIEQKMEEMAGAPAQVRGIRTPGEKTAFEMQDLGSRADRMFFQKLRTFELFMERLINNALEVARRNINGSDLVRVMDDDIGVIEFLKVTKEDITAVGKLRPVGAKHFQAQGQLFQNLNMIYNSPVGNIIMPHTSSKKLAVMVEQGLGLEKFDIIQENVALFEQAEQQRLINQIQENLEVEQMTPDGTEGTDEEIV